MNSILRRVTHPACILLVALALRLAVAVQAWPGAYLEPGSDATMYDEFARLMMSGPGWITAPAVSREPLYPFLMVIAYSLPGPDLGALLILQALLGALAVAIIYLGLRPLAREAVARWAALGVALNPHFVVYTAEFYRENLIIPLLAGLFVAVLHLGTAPTRTKTLATVLLLVLLAHTDARFLMYIAVLPVFVFLLGCSYARTLRVTALACLLFFLLMIPYQVRTFLATGAPTLITDRATVQWLPLLEQRFTSKGASAGAADPRAQWLDEWEAGKTANLDALSADERRVFLAGRRPETRRLQTCWIHFKGFWRFTRLDGDYRPYPDGRFTGLWSLKHTVSSVLVVIPFFLLFPFAWYRSPALERRIVNVIVVFLAVHTAFHTIVHSLERYRIPMETLMAVVAAVAMVNIAESVRGRMGSGDRRLKPVRAGRHTRSDPRNPRPA